MGTTIVKLVLPIPATTPVHRCLHMHAPTHTHVNLVATPMADRRATSDVGGQLASNCSRDGGGGQNPPPPPPPLT